MHKKAHGFTIVELLIVIVVIAILAAISIVAYTGIQERATNSSKAQTVAQYVRALSLRAAEHGDYGRTTTPIGATTCLDGTMTCWPGGTAINSAQNTLLSDALTPIMGSKPVLADHTFVYNEIYGYYIAFRLQGTPSCPNISGATLVNGTIESGRRVCRISLPVPSQN